MSLQPRPFDRRSEANLPAHFVSTSWTAVVTARHSDSPEGGKALSQLCQTYWPPLCAYLLRTGRSLEDAKDLTQQFFFLLLSKNYLEAADRKKGKFRTFLLTSLNHFLANEWDRAQAQKRGAGRALLSLDAEGPEHGLQPEPATPLTPLKLFEQQWARTLFQLALKQLEAECVATGKSALFESAKAFLQETTPSGEYETAAMQLKMSNGAMRVAVHRLRQRYAELIRSEVARTMVNPTRLEIEEEIQHLFEVFDS